MQILVSTFSSRHFPINTFLLICCFVVHLNTTSRLPLKYNNIIFKAGPRFSTVVLTTAHRMHNVNIKTHGVYMCCTAILHIFYVSINISIVGIITKIVRESIFTQTSFTIMHVFNYC